jgi:hypothetical protein
MVGVAIHTPIGKNVAEVAKDVGTGFQLVEFYNAFGSHPFQQKEAEQAVSLDAIPVIQLNPRTVPLSQIAAGKYDGYLRKYAGAVRRFHCRVVLSFGHEMNGRWYSWGCRHTSGAVFIAAWRRIVTDMRSATNITWLWTVNVEFGRDCLLVSRWPGGKYVDWVGVDGYLRSPGTNYSDTFGPTIGRLRRLAPGKPLLVAETGVLPGPGQGQRILNIYHGAAGSHMLGVIYFDGATRQFGDYRPQDNPAALTAFRAGLRYFQAAASAASRGTACRGRPGALDPQPC